MYSSPGMFVVRADSPYKTIRDLVGKRVAFGAKGSGLPILSRYVLDGLGLKQDDDFQSIYLDRASDGPAMVLDGQVAALWGAGIGWPGFSTMAASPPGARFIAPDASEIARIRAKHSFLKPLTVPAGSYPNQTAPIDSVGSWSFILARESLPDDIAYRLARALHSAEATFCKKLAQACETTAASTVAAAPKEELLSTRYSLFATHFFISSPANTPDRAGRTHPVPISSRVSCNNPTDICSPQAS